MEPHGILQLEPVRAELGGYLCRLVLRPEVAEELVQATYLKALEAPDSVPESPEALRAWLFRVATNLALDTLKRHSNRRENLVFDLRAAAEADPAFVASSMELASTPETRAIAREHLAACFACVLRNLPEHKAATLLLTEVHGFSVAETAAMLGARPAQVKNWIQQSRAHMTQRYDATCALIEKGGVCHQCVELAGFMRGDAANPLAATAGDVDARLSILRSVRDRPWPRWHRLMFELLDDLERGS